MHSGRCHFYRLDIWMLLPWWPVFCRRRHLLLIGHGISFGTGRNLTLKSAPSHPCRNYQSGFLGVWLSGCPEGLCRTITSMRKHLSETTGLQRLTYGLVTAVAVVALPLPMKWEFRVLLAWCVGLAVYLCLAWWLCRSFDAKRTRERAQAQDEPSVVLFLVLLLATAACVAAITVLMQQSRDLSGFQRGLHIGLSVLALAVSWLFIQTIFTFRYAHRYYFEEKQDEPDGPGLVFPGGLDPDYFDFLYYAHVVGMTSQVSDVQVTSHEMRHLTLVHSVLSFGFNMLILALSINVVAGSL